MMATRLRWDRPTLRRPSHAVTPICLLSHSVIGVLRVGVSLAETSAPRATMLGVNTAPPDPLLLVLGDEELLAARAVTAAVDAARAAEPDADVREYEGGAISAGEVAEMLSPSLFGGRRVLVIRSGQDARKDLIAALLAYAKSPDPEVTLIVT